MCKRIQPEKDFVEKEFAYKVKTKPLGFDVNLGDQAIEEDDEVQETNISEDFEERDESKQWQINKADDELVELTAALKDEAPGEN